MYFGPVITRHSNGQASRIAFIPKIESAQAACSTVTWTNTSLFYASSVSAPATKQYVAAFQATCNSNSTTMSALGFTLTESTSNAGFSNLRVYGENATACTNANPTTLNSGNGFGVTAAVAASGSQTNISSFSGQPTIGTTSSSNRACVYVVVDLSGSVTAATFSIKLTSATCGVSCGAQNVPSSPAQITITKQCTSVTTGTWSTAANWAFCNGGAGGSAPTASDNVYIGANTAMTVGANTTVASVTLNSPDAGSNSIVINDTFTLTVTNALTYTANSTANAQTITLGSSTGAGNLMAGSITIPAATGSGASKIICGNASNTGTVTVSGTGTIAITGSSTASGGVSGIDLSAGACSLTTGTGTTTLTGGSVSAALIKTGTGTLNIKGAVTLSASANSQIVTSNGSTLKLDAAPAFSVGAGAVVTITASTNLTNNSGSSTWNIAESTWGVCTVTAGTLSFGNAAQTCNRVSVASGGILQFAGSTFTSTTTTDVTGTLQCTGGATCTGLKTFTGAVTVNSGGVFNLGNGTVDPTETFGAGITMNGTTFNAGTGGATITGTNALAGSSNMIFGGTLAVGTLTNNNTGIVTVTGVLSGTAWIQGTTTNTLKLGASPTITTLTADGTNNTVEYTFDTPTCKTPSNGYYSLTFSGSGTVTCAITAVPGNLTTSGTVSWTLTAATNLTVGGIFTIGNGTTFSTGANILTLTASGTPFVVNGTFNSSTGTVRYTNTTSATAASTNYYNLDFAPASGTPSYNFAPGSWKTSYTSSGTVIKSMGFDPTNQVIYASGGRFRCDLSTQCNEGTDWTLSNTTTGNSMVFDSANGVLYADDGGGSIIRCAVSTLCDAAGDWTTSYATAQNSVTSMTIDSVNGVVYAGTQTNGIIYRCATSTLCDAAGDWTTSIDTTETNIASLVFANGVIYAGTNSSGFILRCDTSTLCDAAGDWTTSYDSPAITIFSLAFDSSNGVIYAGGSSTGIIYRCAISTLCDAAGDWTTSYDSPEIDILSMAFDSVNGVIYAGSYNLGYIYRCDTSTLCDAAGDWTTIANGLGQGVYSILVANGTMFAGTGQATGVIYTREGLSVSHDLTVATGSVVTAPRATINGGGSISNSGSLTFAFLATSCATGTVTANTSFTVTGSFSNGSTCTLSPTSGTYTLSGSSFINNGTFTASGSHTLLLTNSGTTTIGGSASTTFNNLTDTTAGSTLKFANDAGGATPLYTFAGATTITGAVGNHITITSDNQPTNKWMAHFNSATSTITHITVSYSDCDGTSATVTLDSDSTDGSPGGTNGSCWSFPSAGNTISGFFYDTNESTGVVGISLKLSRSAGTAQTYTTTTGGAFTFTVSSLVAGNIVTIYSTDATTKGTLVFRYGASCTGTPDCTGLSIVKGAVGLNTYDGTAISNTDLSACDNDSGTGCNSADVGFTSNAGAMSVGSARKLIIWGNYTPAGTVTTTASSTAANQDGDLNIKAGATLTMGTNALSIGGDYNNAGTLAVTSPQTTTFTATGSGFGITKGTGEFDALTFNGASGDWTLQDNESPTGNVTVTAGTLKIGSTTLTVAAGKVLSVGASGGLDNGSGTIKIYGTGTAGSRPFQVAGTFTGSTGSVEYRGDGDTTIEAVSYHYLYFKPLITASRLYTSNGALNIYSLDEFNNADPATSFVLTFKLGGNFTASSLLFVDGGYGIVTFDTDAVNSYSVQAPKLELDSTTTFNANGSTITLTGSGSGVSRPFLGGGTFNAGTSTFIYSGTSASDIQVATYNNLSFSPASAATYTLPAADITLRGNLTIGANTTVTKSASNKIIFARSSTGTSTITGNATNSDLGIIQVSNGGGVTTLSTSSSIKITSITVDASQNLDITSDTVTLTGITNPLVLSGSNTFTVTGSTVVFTGNGANAIPATTYNNLELKPSSSSWQVLGAGTFTINGNLTVGDGTNQGAAADSSNAVINVTGNTTVASGATFYAGSGAWSFGGDLTVNGGMFASTAFSVTANGNVTGSGEIALKSAGSFTQRVSSSKNFGSTSGSTSWSFKDLTFSNSNVGATPVTITTQNGGSGKITVFSSLTIGQGSDTAGATTTLDAGSRLWQFATVEGSWGNTSTGGFGGFTITSSRGIFTPNGSTFNYQGLSGPITVTSTTYNNLDIRTKSDVDTAGTYNLGGNVTVNGALTIGNAGSTNADTLTTTASNYSLTAGSINITAKGVLNANSSAVTVTGTSFTNNGSYSGGASITFNNSGIVTIGGASSTTFTGFTDTTAGSTLKFANDAGGATPLYTFAGTATITGAVGNHITITSDNQPTNAWIAHFNTTQNTITHVTVSYSDCDAGSSTVNLDSDSTLGSGNNASHSGCWNIPSGNTISGFFYDTNESTGLVGIALKLSKSAGTAQTYTTTTGGAFTFTVSGLSAGNIVTIYSTDATSKGTLVFRYGASCTGTPNCTGLSIVKGAVGLNTYDGTAISNTDLSACDNDSGTGCNSTDLGFTSNAGAMSVSSARKLIIWGNYTPAGTVTTTASSTAANQDGDLNIKAGATLTMGTNALSIGGDYNNAGTLAVTSPQTTTFTATGSGFGITKGTGEFDALTFNGASGDWTFQDNELPTGTVTISAGALNLTKNLSIAVGKQFIVNAGGTISGNISGNLLMYGSGTGASRPFYVNGGTMNGGFVPQYLGDGNTDIEGGSFNSLYMTPGTLTADRTYTTLGNITITGNTAVFRAGPTGAFNLTINLGGTFTTPGDLTVGRASGSTTTTFNTNNYAVSVGYFFDIVALGIVNAGSSTITLACGDTGYPSAFLTVTGTFNAQTSTVTYTSTHSVEIAAVTYNNLSFAPTSGSPTYTLGTAAAQTITVNALTIGNGVNAVAVTAATYNPDLNLLGNLTLNASSTYTKGSGLTTFKKGGTQTLTDNTASKQDLGIVQISNGGGDTTLNLGSSVKVTTLTIDASQTLSLNGSNTLTITGSGSVGARPFVNNGIFTASTGTVDYEGTSATDIETTNVSYNALNLGTTSDVAAGVTYSLNGNAVVTGLITIGNAGSTNADTLTTTGSNYSLTSGQITITAKGALTANGSTFTITGSTGTPFTNNGTFTPGSSTVKFTGIGDASIQAMDYNNLWFNNSNYPTYTIGAGTMNVNDWTVDTAWVALDTNTPTVNITGDFSVTTSAYVQGGSATLVFKKGGTQILNANGQLPNVRVSASGGGSATTLSYTQTGGIATSMSSLTVDNNQSVNLNSNTLMITGTTSSTCTNQPLCLGTGVTFNTTGSTVEYRSASTATLAPTTYNNLVLNKYPDSAVYTLPSGNITVTGNLEIDNNATVTKGSGTIIFAKAGGGTSSWTDYNGTPQDMGAVQVSANSGVTTLNLGSLVKATSLLIDASQIVNLGTYTLTLTGNSTPLTATGTLNDNTGTIEFASAATTGTTVPARTYYNLKLNKAGNTFTVPAGTLAASNNLDITAGTLDLNTNDPTTTVSGTLTIGGTLSASSTNNLTFAGDFINNGTFTHNGGTVVADMTGTADAAKNINIGGSAATTTFNNFTVSNVPAQNTRTLTFKTAVSSPPEFDFNGVADFRGKPSNLLQIQSDTPGTQWMANILSAGSSSINFVSIKDGGCANGTKSFAINDTIYSLGNNGTCWGFINRGGGNAVGNPGLGGGSGGGTPGGGGGGQGGGGGSTSGGGGGVLPQAFTASDATSLTQYDSSWTVLAGSFAIKTNAISATGGASTHSIAKWTVGSFGNDQYAETTLNAIGADYMGVCVRLQAGSTSGYCAEANNAGTRILRITNGSVAATLFSDSTVLSVGEILHLEITGSSLTLKRGSTVITSNVSDATYSSGMPGLKGYGNAQTTLGDNWYAGTLAAQGGGGGGISP